MNNQDEIDDFFTIDLNAGSKPKKKSTTTAAPPAKPHMSAYERFHEVSAQNSRKHQIMHDKHVDARLGIPRTLAIFNKA